MHEIKKEGKRDDEITTWVFERFTPVAKIQGDKHYSIISDHIGTPILATDEQGNKVWEREVDIYGRIRKETKERTNFVPFLFQGQYFDSETDLCYNRFRYYSPDEGVYISQDPIGLAGNNPTLYAYVHDTNSWVDPLGLNAINDLGQIGEINAGITKNTLPIPALSGKREYRIPDAMSKNQRRITEVKNVNYQYFSSQLKDDLAHVNRGGKRGTVTLIVDTRTKLSRQLQVEIDEKRIKLKRKNLNKCGGH